MTLISPSILKKYGIPFDRVSGDWSTLHDIKSHFIGHCEKHSFVLVQGTSTLLGLDASMFLLKPGLNDSHGACINVEPLATTKMG